MKITIMSPGFGPSHGGVGMVAMQIRNALAPHFSLEVHDYNYRTGKLKRRLTLLAQTGLLALRQTDLLLFTHIDVAQVYMMAPRFARSPYAVFLHGMELWKPLDGLKREALENATLLLANSEQTVKTTREFNPWLPKVQVVHLGIEEPQPLSLAPRKQQALIVGRMASNERLKGHDEILSAWPRVCATLPSARLVIVGSGDDRLRLEHRVESEQIPNVDFRGFVDDQEKRRLYAESPVFLFPSRQEGFGLAALEAAAAGMAVVGCRGTVMEEIFSGNHGITLVDASAPDQLSRAVISLLHDPTLSLRLGRAAAEHVRSHFLERHFAERFVTAIRTCVS